MIKTNRVKAMLVGMLGLFLASAAMAADINSRIFDFQKKLAESGNVQAQYKLAFMYEIGRGVEKDTDKAKQWYKQSADKDYAAAKFRLQYLDIQKTGFKPQHAKWLENLKDAANNGDEEAMYLVAELYEAGTGVEMDLDMARRYFQKATAKGNPNAETRLFKIDQKINANKQQTAASKAAQKEAEQDKAEEQRQRAQQAQAEEERRQRELQQKASIESKRLAAERKRLEAEKQKLEKQKQELAKREAEAARAKVEKQQADKLKAEAKQEVKQEEVFEADSCSGAAARFRTQCN